MAQLRIPSLFKAQEPKQFNFTPRYYDADKERHEKLKKKYNVKNTEEAIAVSKNNIRDSYDSHRRAEIQRGSFLSGRFLLVLAVIMVTAYFIFYN